MNSECSSDQHCDMIDVGLLNTESGEQHGMFLLDVPNQVTAHLAVRESAVGSATAGDGCAATQLHPQPLDHALSVDLNHLRGSQQGWDAVDSVNVVQHHIRVGQHLGAAIALQARHRQWIWLGALQMRQRRIRRSLSWVDVRWQLGDLLQDAHSER
jgi:hypothetical protein